jgi:hypothetical protein
VKRARRFSLLATITLLSCSPSHPIQTHPEAVTRALAAKPHRLAVVFWPQLSNCASCDQLISAVIADWQAEPGAEVAVVSVVPESARALDPWLPGAVVRLKSGDYKRFAAGSPLPRVELRDADGGLLMSRSVPNYGSQATLLTEEMLAARSFTTPVSVASQSEASR